MKIVFTMAIPEELQKEFAKQFETDKTYYTDNLENFPELKEVDVIVTYGSDLTEPLIHAAENLKWIMVYSAGVDSLPAEAITRRQIKVSNVRGIHAYPMAEFVMAYLLDDVKQLRFFSSAQQKKQYASEHPVVELGEKTIAIAGTGAIGIQVARFAKTFQMKTIGFNTTGHKAESFDKTYPLKNLSELVSEVDYFVSVLPKTKETNEIYGRNFFESLPNQAVFINIGRGNVTTKEVLEEAIQANAVRHFYLDVFPEEPLPIESPLWEAENVTLTPHVSGHTDQYLKRSFQIFADNIIRFKKNEALVNLIDLKRGY
ncbi:D-2-hydroxyacid dehydrogenase [Listeria aquatica]|uniref:D-2-hydroxyacid dehydrogenase n=1 Tax=Listeria aquatica TaxID=1494960 RepID=UPI003F724F38